MRLRTLVGGLVLVGSLYGCATGAGQQQPLAGPGVLQGDVIAVPGRQAVMIYADVKQGVRDLLNLVESLCAKKANAKQCGDVPHLRQQFHDLDVKTRGILLSPAPTGPSSPDYAAIAEVLGKLIGVAAGIAL